VAALPLDLLSFKAAKSNTSVELKWVSANEVDFSHYNVQKSNDGKIFTPFAKVKATGSGSYQTLDEKPSAGQNYYRLEMVDIDGKRKYSNIVSVAFDTKGTTMSVYPNPAQGSTLTIDMSVNNDSEFTFTITDIAGRNRLTSQQKAIQGTNQLPLDISSLEKGIYFITTRNTTNQEVLRTMRFIKQ
jgi:Secretion system C-terminal sorting domain